MRHILWVAFGILFLNDLATAQPQRPPNVVIIMADDLGYGDLGCYGHPSIRTPNLDRMAREGMRFTDFYSCAAVCTPSRAGLLTGRYPVRSGMTSSKRRVLFPNSTGGLPAEEITIAEALEARGYATACIGKWHLGHRPEYLPTKHGFDYYFGLPYSNDMDGVPGMPRGGARSLDPKVEWWNVPLLRNGEVVERPADQHRLTQRYTEEAASFIKRNKDEPFFVYLPHSMPHVPLFASKQFQKTSPRGLYGDVIEELDWSVGQIIQALTDEKLAENTLVIFTSDNGPWLTQGLAGGSAGLLREGKGSTWDGGMRVPCIAWWPGKVPDGEINRDIACNLDLFNTTLDLAGAEVPKDREIDGVSMVPTLTASGHGNRDRFFYYRDEQLFAVRKGPFKLHLKTQSGYGQPRAQVHEAPLLFHLDQDPSEKHNLAAEYPEVVADLLREAREHDAAVKPGADQLAGVR
jgi:arylsulfatase A-like enzyme